MIYRDFQDLHLSLLGFGTMRLPTTVDGAIDEDTTQAMVDYALAHGVNYFDTAWPYHSGKSEPFVGKVLSKLDRDSFYIATKLPMFTIESLEQAKEIFNTQLEHLQTDHVDYYLLHSLDEAKWQKVLDLGLLPFLEEQQRLGRIRKLGFSFHAPMVFSSA